MRRLTATLLDRIGLLPVETTLLQIVGPRQKGIERGERGIFGLLNRLVHRAMILEFNAPDLPLISCFHRKIVVFGS
jgi:hypothetical protein